MSHADRTLPGARFFLALALAIIWTPALAAKTTLIDDSGTLALEPSVNLRWKNAAPARGGADTAMVARTTLRVHLSVLPWLKRHGRIYLALPAQPPGPITATWTTQGHLAPGRVQSGGRVLLYSGPITTPFIEDVVTFQFSVDGRLVRRPFPVNLRFEMDED
jgi:hypothetical protein